ncbi:hypothetical protein [Haladaptatus salinisoli]|uniref:hypothetical protein n=1 Tax=Haladaptatus salinisoli TaxID=2884876 RepID=UPI001D0A19CB|nr:hypothetical protein [Haladaptatus salinisoli]
METDIEFDSKYSQVTTEHETIEQWVEDRGGEPATVESTADGGAGILRLQFPDTADDHDELVPVEWDEWFEKFESEDLAFVYQVKTESGNTSRFYKLVDRKTARRHS